MYFKSACVVAALAVVACMASASSEAASPVIRGRFSYDGIANCQQPPIQNFRFHAEGTAALSTDRTASLDVKTSTSGRTKLSAALVAGLRRLAARPLLMWWDGTRYVPFGITRTISPL